MQRVTAGSKLWAWFVSALVATLVTGCTASRVDELIATDSGLRQLSTELDDTYVRVLNAATADQVEALKLGHQLWLEGRAERCLNAYIRPEGARIARESECLRKTMEERHAWLWSTLHRSRVAGPASETEAALCQELIGKERLSWRGRSGGTRGTFEDTFVYTAPTGGFAHPATVVLAATETYRIEKARYDFYGDEKPVAVYQVVPGRVIEPSWFAVALSGEEAALDLAFRQALTRRYSYEEIQALRELAVRLDGGAAPMMLPEWINGVQQREPVRKPPFFASARVLVPRLTETTSPLRPFTNAFVHLYNGKAYVVADNQRGVLALFKPRRGDTMAIVCRHVAGESSVRRVVSKLGDRYPCPPAADLPLSDIVWREERPTDASAVLDLADWGGRRPLAKVTMRDGFIFPKVFVGPVGEARAVPAPKPTDRPDHLWQPIFAAFGHDEVDIKRAGEAAYVLGRDYPQPRDRSQEPPTTYYRIAGNALVPVCRVENQVIPPSGYQAAR